MSHVADPSLAQQGADRIEWAFDEMPVVRALTEEFSANRPFEGLTVATCLHVTTETANLLKALKAGGANVSICASNPLSTQDDVAAALAAEGIKTFAIRGEDHDSYYAHIDAVLDTEPQFTIDDGADLVSTLHLKREDQARRVIAGSEETTTGVIRLRQMEADSRLLYPIVAINDTPTKHLFDNRFGTGQSAVDGILRATNVLLAGRVFVVAGYGYCGRGVASRAKGLGSRVVVCEIDPVRAIEAAMEGFEVLPMSEAVKIGDIFCTVTGNRDVLREEHFESMRDGAIVCNAGHFDIEIDVEWLRKNATSVRSLRRDVESFTLASGGCINLLAEGRLVNLSAAEGHPAAVMDMSFAGQALTLLWLAELHRDGKIPDPQVLEVPRVVDERIASTKLAAMGTSIDKLTDAQREYLSSWQTGT